MPRRGGDPPSDPPAIIGDEQHHRHSPALVAVAPSSSPSQQHRRSHTTATAPQQQSPPRHYHRAHQQSSQSQSPQQESQHRRTQTDPPGFHPAVARRAARAAAAASAHQQQQHHHPHDEQQQQQQSHHDHHHDEQKQQESSTTESHEENTNRNNHTEQQQQQRRRHQNRTALTNSSVDNNDGSSLAVLVPDEDRATLRALNAVGGSAGGTARADGGCNGAGTAGGGTAGTAATTTTTVNHHHHHGMSSRMGHQPQQQQHSEPPPQPHFQLPHPQQPDEIVPNDSLIVVVAPEDVAQRRRDNQAQQQEHQRHSNLGGNQQQLPRPGEEAAAVVAVELKEDEQTQSRPQSQRQNQTNRDRNIEPSTTAAAAGELDLRDEPKRTTSTTTMEEDPVPDDSDGSEDDDKILHHSHSNITISEEEPAVEVQLGPPNAHDEGPEKDDTSDAGTPVNDDDGISNNQYEALKLKATEPKPAQAAAESREVQTAPPSYNDVKLRDMAKENSDDDDDSVQLEQPVLKERSVETEASSWRSSPHSPPAAEKDHGEDNEEKEPVSSSPAVEEEDINSTNIPTTTTTTTTTAEAASSQRRLPRDTSLHNNSFSIGCDDSIVGALPAAAVAGAAVVQSNQRSSSSCCDDDQNESLADSDSRTPTLDLETAPTEDAVVAGSLFAAKENEAEATAASLDDRFGSSVALAKVEKDEEDSKQKLDPTSLPQQQSADSETTPSEDILSVNTEAAIEPCCTTDEEAGAVDGRSSSLVVGGGVEEESYPPLNNNSSGSVDDDDESKSFAERDNRQTTRTVQDVGVVAVAIMGTTKSDDRSSVVVADGKEDDGTQQQLDSNAACVVMSPRLSQAGKPKDPPLNRIVDDNSSFAEQENRPTSRRSVVNSGGTLTDVPVGSFVEATEHKSIDKGSEDLVVDDDEKVGSKPQLDPSTERLEDPPLIYSSSADDASFFVERNNEPTPRTSIVYYPAESSNLSKTSDARVGASGHGTFSQDGFDGEETKEPLEDPLPSCYDTEPSVESAVAVAAAPSSTSTAMEGGSNVASTQAVVSFKQNWTEGIGECDGVVSDQDSKLPDPNIQPAAATNESQEPLSNPARRSIDSFKDLEEQPHSVKELATTQRVQSLVRNEPPMENDDRPTPISMDSLNLHRRRISASMNSVSSSTSQLGLPMEPPDPTQVPTNPGAYDVVKITPAGSVTYEVIAPAECLPGDAFDVQAGNRTAEVTVPLDYEAGQPLEITLPPDSITTYKPLKVAMLTASPAAERAWRNQPIHHCRRRGNSIGGAFPMSGPIKDINLAAIQAGKSVARTHIVTVPEGVAPGQTFQASADGFMFAVMCPASNRAGDRIRIVPPPPPPEPSKAMQYFRVQVPPGVEPGDQFAATIDNTHERLEVLVECPEGRAGKTITVGLPTQTVVGKIALSYESQKRSGWRRTVRAADLHFQWVRLRNGKSSSLSRSTLTEAIHSFDFFKSAYVRQVIELEGYDPRLSTANIRLVPAAEADTASKFRLGGKTIISYADLALQQVRPLAEKHDWFISMCRELTSLHNTVKPPNPDDVVNDSYVEIFVRRDRLLKDSLRGVLSLSVAQMRANWRIRWIGEPALDDGGLTKEWFHLVTNELFDPATGLFVGVNENNQAVVDIHPGSGSQCQDTLLMYYRFAGRVLGRALFSNHQINGHLVRTLHKHLLGWPITYEDIRDQDEAFYMSLKRLAKMKDLCSLELNFTKTESINGQYVNIELVEGGADIEVTSENLAEYLEAILRYRVFDRTLPQLTELLLGFYDVIPEPALTVFDAGELELLLCGLPSIDVEDWKVHTEYGGEFETSGLSDPVVKWFWELVEDDFDMEMRARLLQFATGTSSVPSSGFDGLRGHNGRPQKFTLHGTDPQTCFYPKAHTCFNRIDCPLYPSKELLRERLTFSIMTSYVGFDDE